MLMSTYVLSHLPDPVLLRDLAALVAQERTTTAAVLAHIAEVDARRLYLPAGFPSMHAYCVGELRLSEDAAYKPIQAARVARQFPTLFTALAEGRLHLTGLGLLAPHLTVANAGELLTAAAYQTKSDIELLLAQRFPHTELLALVQAIPPVLSEPLAPAQVEARVPRPKLTPLAAERFALQFTIGKDTHDMLQHAQALLSHTIPSGDVATVFHRALKALIPQLEKQKFAATAKPRPRSPRPSANTRHIPEHVKRAVWERDQGRCTFVSESGQRCRSRQRLEYDHIDPVARGGQATVERVRFLCRGHNQYEAERTFGAGFMSEKRREARRAAAERRARAAAAAERDKELAKERDVVLWLRRLGFRADEARRAAAFCETIPDAPLEERVRVALSCLSRTPSRCRAAAAE
jgi:5-methylcytosine-specific restriction endonuclease McrA